MESEATAPEPVWPERTWILVALGLIAGLAIQQLLDLPDSGWEWGKRLVSALVLFLGVGVFGFALVWKRGRHVPAIGIALLCGLVAGGVFIWNGLPGGGEFFSWQMFCGLIGSGFLLAIFQVAQDRHPALPAQWTWRGIVAWKRQALDYPSLHRAI